MDGSSAGGISVSPEDMQKLSPSDVREIQVMIQNETQKANVQQCKALRYSLLLRFNSSLIFLGTYPLTCLGIAVHGLTEVCFKKCITGYMSASSGKLAGKEETCISNCVERYMDSNFAILKHLETLRQSQ